VSDDLDGADAEDNDVDDATIDAVMQGDAPMDAPEWAAVADLIAGAKAELEDLGDTASSEAIAGFVQARQEAIEGERSSSKRRRRRRNGGLAVVVVLGGLGFHEGLAAAVRDYPSGVQRESVARVSHPPITSNAVPDEGTVTSPLSNGAASAATSAEPSIPPSDSSLDAARLNGNGGSVHPGSSAQPEQASTSSSADHGNPSPPGAAEGKGKKCGLETADPSCPPSAGRKP
jgi:hypothetical protein